MGIGLVRVPAAQGKQGKWPKIFCQGKNTGNLNILPNTQGKQMEFCFLKL